MALLGSPFSYAAMCWKNELVKKYSMPDDTLDAWALHGVGGIMGSLLTGLFANPAISGNPEIAGAFYGKPIQIVIQMMGVTAVALWAFFASYALLEIIEAFLGCLGSSIAAAPEDELEGLDSTDHGALVEPAPSLRSVTLGHVTTAQAEERESAVMEAYNMGPDPELGPESEDGHLPAQRSIV